MRIIRDRIRASVSVVIAATLLTASDHAQAIGFDGNDYLIAGYASDTISVFDHDWTFKGHLDPSFANVSGLDFDAAGRLVATGRNPSQVRVFEQNGTRIDALSYLNTDIASPIDLKVMPSGNYLIGTQSAAMEFGADGSTLRTFATGDYEGIAITSSNSAWGGQGNSSSINVFNLTTGTTVTSFALDNGQRGADSMFYSALTDTVLISDESSNYVFERGTDGALIRTFTTSGFDRSFGVTRGPGGDVFATSYDGSNEVYHWRADGTFVESFNLPEIDGPLNIIWGGNAVPEPAVAGLLGAGCLVLAQKRRRG